MDEFWNEVIEEYVSECTEMLEEMEHQLLSSEQLDQALAADLFRPLHSFKGSSASIGLAVLAKVTHSAENLLSFFNKGEFSSPDKKYIQFFLFFSDYMKLSFDRVLVDKNDSNCHEGSADIINLANELVQEIQKQLSGGGVAPIPPVEISLADEEHFTSPNVEPAVVEAEKGAVNSIEHLLDPELLAAFITESFELFGLIEQKLLHLTKSPDDTEALREIFRHIHSFKGNCGIFSFADLESMGHLVETIFDGCIQGLIPRDRCIYDAIISILDIFQETLTHIQEGKDPHIDGIDLYREMLSGFIPPSAADQSVEPPKESKPAPVHATKVDSSDEASAIKNQKMTSSVAKPTYAEKAMASNKMAAGDNGNKGDDSSAAKRQDIRVDIRKLDILNDLVGELVTVKTMVQENLKQQVAWEYSEKTFRLLDRISSDLQDVSMSIRMVPVGGLFKKMIRIVHDLSSKLNKKVDFSFIGEETEIDKTIIEKIGDPLVHMIRNALDHGIEETESRIQSGKNPHGTIMLEAKNEGGEIWIIITDDGKGINREAILKKAASLGVLDREPESYTDQEVFSMIFLPSFSTAEKVSDISGRGVGMDVVRKNIEEIKGRIEIDSRLGKGTIFTIKIPLTLAIIQGMMVRVGENSFILPIETVSESVVVDRSMLTHPMGEREMVKIRDHILPVISLGNLFSLKTSITQGQDGVLILAEGRGRKMALLVDQLVGQREAVVKPIPSIFKHVKGISGCSIMGDGEMSLILDIGGIVDMTGRMDL